MRLDQKNSARRTIGMRCRCSSPDVGVLFYSLYQFLVFVSIVGGGSGDDSEQGVGKRKCTMCNKVAFVCVEKQLSL